MTEFNQLKGKTLVHIDVDKLTDVITFTEDNGTRYKCHHYQDCCESVFIENVNGDINDLLNTPILLAEERTSDAETKEMELERLLKQERAPTVDEAELWTFYELRTIKGSVTIRWNGSSNGYYSISVDFDKV